MGSELKAGVRGCYLHGDLYPQHTCKQTSQRSIGVALSCHSTKSLRDSLLPDGLRIIPRVEMVGSGGSALS
jgi:hypothetical protein